MTPINMIYYLKTFKYTLVYLLRSNQDDSKFLHPDPVQVSLRHLKIVLHIQWGYHYIYLINNNNISGYDEYII